ncbi:MAG: right-handed parallel beta-helix repeat-containing protein [Anaerolineae bacterium]
MIAKRLSLLGLVAAGLTLALALLLQASSSRAAGPYFATPAGSGTTCSQSTPCSLATALDLASNGDTIYLSSGTYTGTGAAVVVLTKTVTLQGGWNGAGTGALVVDPDLYITTLDGEGARRVVQMVGDISPTLDGLVIAHGACISACTEGGGISVAGGAPVISHCVITACYASEYGGGVMIRAGEATLTANRFLSNTTVYGGGGLSTAGNVTLTGNRFAWNTSAYGGAVHNNGTLTATGNFILHSNASSAIISAGPSTLHAYLANNIIAGHDHNAIEIRGHPATLLHNTIANNGGPGISAGYIGAVVTVTNNILASNAGQSLQSYSSAILTVDHNLFWNNQSDPILGSHSVQDDPLFVDLAGGNYHLQKTSPAIDRGIDLGIGDDIDGDTRPYGSAPDIGADEVKTIISLFLPLVRR